MKQRGERRLHRLSFLSRQGSGGSPELCADVPEGVEGVGQRGGVALRRVGARRRPAVHLGLHGEVVADDLHAAHLIAHEGVRP